MSNFGIWAMILFWGSAIGGIATAIIWGKHQNKKRPTQKSPDQKSDD